MKHRARRVVITGIGILAPNGLDKEQFWLSLLYGRSGVKKIKSFDASKHKTRIAGMIEGFNPLLHLPFGEAKRMSRFSQFAVVAARMAAADASFTSHNTEPERTGVIIGVSVNGLEVIEKQVNILQKRGPESMSPFTVNGALPNAAAGHIAIDRDIKGRAITISTGCSSSLNAIGHAYELIKYGKLDTAVCGGSEAPVTASILGAFCAANALSRRNEDPEKASRPFDRQRDGYILGEGAAIFVAEELRSALKRNVPIYGEITGYASTCEAYSMYKMDESGEEAARVMSMAVREAGISSGDVDYVSAHGSSSYVSDIRETRAIKRVFNGRSGKVKISSIKSMIGHPLGASGGLQLAGTLMAGKNGYIHPTINYENPDPQCDLDYVPNEAVRKRVSVSMINSFGIGGNNASLVVRMGNSL
ncbi:MAG TPA: beta-ketoacyl-[acyl-carrier-protein] synthase family protein [bacterium]|nr:beta-ketoacyl-[acyl-carrier-protein] synthase family protein [bacterium]